MNEVGGELCNDALQQLSCVSIYTQRAVTVSGCLTSCLLLSLLSISIHRLTASTNRLQQQVGWGGAAVSWSSPWSTSTLPSYPPCMGRIAPFCTCTVLVCWASDGC